MEIYENWDQKNKKQITLMGMLLETPGNQMVLGGPKCSKLGTSRMSLERQKKIKIKQIKKKASENTFARRSVADLLVETSNTRLNKKHG